MGSVGESVLIDSRRPRGGLPCRSHAFRRCAVLGWEFARAFRFVLDGRCLGVRSAGWVAHRPSSMEEIALLLP